MKKWLIGISFLLIILISFLATRAYYQKKARVAPTPLARSNMPPPFSLPSEQKQKIEIMDDRFNHTCELLCREMDRRRLRLIQEILRPDFDPATADALIDEIAHYQGAMEKETVRHIIEVKKTLPTQQQKALLSGVSSELRGMCGMRGNCQFRRRMGFRHRNPYEEENQQ
jgi:Spy/CpxP family protein refolding chaperone